MLSKFFIDRPKFAIVVSLVIILAGAVSITQLAISMYPEITPPEVRVSAFYPGASAEVVEATVDAYPPRAPPPLAALLSTRVSLRSTTEGLS